MTPNDLPGPETSGDGSTSSDNAQLPSADLSGHLHAEARRAMLELLARGVVLKRKRPQDYTALVRWQADVRASLSDLELEMQIDDRYEIAMLLKTEVAEEQDDESPALIRARALTLNDTLVVLVLRSYFREREMAGDMQVFFDIEQLMSWMIPYKPLVNKATIEAGHMKGIVDRLKDANIVLGLRGELERWEISPVIRTVVNLEFGTRLLEEYRQIAATGKPVSNGNE